MTKSINPSNDTRYRTELDALVLLNTGTGISEVALKLGLARSTLQSRLHRTFSKEIYKKAQSGTLDFSTLNIPNYLYQEYFGTSSNSSDSSIQPDIKLDIKPDTESNGDFDETYSYTVTGNSITITDILDQNIHTTLYSDQVYFKELHQAILSKNTADVKNLIDKVALIHNKSNGDINITNMDLKILGKSVPQNYLNIIQKELDNNEFGLTNIVQLFKRCIEHNVEDTVVEQLYNFLKHNDITILPNGTILGWKYVQKDENDDYVDDYTGLILNNEGNVVTMDRNKVDSNPNITCSQGLHVGAWEYVENRTYIASVLVHPEDVVAIPTDYNGMKMRCCKYKVLEIVKDAKDPKSFEMYKNYMKLLDIE